MNIFFLDRNPEVCAVYHNDKHVVKMIVELAQMLSTCHRLLNGKPEQRTSKSGRTIRTVYHLRDLDGDVNSGGSNRGGCKGDYNKNYEETLYMNVHEKHPCI